MSESPNLIESILITGRGEVAARVERTCTRLGVDLGSNDMVTGTHWQPEIDTVLRAAKLCGAKAVHPGYVCPASRGELAEAVRAAGLVFVGPSAPALELMRDKLAMKRMALACGLRVIPGSDGPVESAELARHELARLESPIMLKPVAGTAGVGVMRADDEDAVDGAFSEATSRAQEAFGDGRVFVERALFRPRQLEVTVMADQHGNRVVFGERECSLQRMHRVLVAESPAPLLSLSADPEPLREALAESVSLLAEEMQLVGVATFEFLWDGDDGVYFLEANANMHGALLTTEMLNGLDPIELQLRLANGEELPAETRLRSSGHAFEVRICAEDPSENFRRDGSTLEAMRFPPAPHGKVRFEPAVELGESASEIGEPLLARVATHGPTRHQALLALDRTLAETRIGPMATNLAYLREALNHENFRAGRYDTAFTASLSDRSRT